MVVTPEARPAVIAFGLDRGRAVTCAPATNQTPTKSKVIEMQTPIATRLALRLLNYPAWRVTVDGQEIQPERMDDVNQMIVPVDAGHSVIRVQFVRTADRIGGDVLSVISVSLVAMLFWTSRRLKSSRGQEFAQPGRMKVPG